MVCNIAWGLWVLEGMGYAVGVGGVWAGWDSFVRSSLPVTCEGEPTNTTSTPITGDHS